MRNHCHWWWLRQKRYKSFLVLLRYMKSMNFAGLVLRYIETLLLCHKEHGMKLDLLITLSTMSATSCSILAKSKEGSFKCLVSTLFIYSGKMPLTQLGLWEEGKAVITAKVTERQNILRQKTLDIVIGKEFANKHLQEYVAIHLFSHSKEFLTMAEQKRSYSMTNPWMRSVQWFCNS